MNRLIHFSIFLLLFFLAACNPAGGSEPAMSDAPGSDKPALAEVPPAAEEAPATAACAAPGEGQYQLLAAAYGYCLHYPDNYQVVQTAANSVNIVLDSLLNVSDPRMGLEIKPAEGKTAAELAEAMMAEFPADFGLTSETITLAGETAVMIDNMPGQDLNRRVFVVKDDQLYDFFFSPVDPEKNPEGQMEIFYQGIMDSFQFVPVVAEAPLQDGPECVAETADTVQLRHEAGGFCFLMPAAYSMDDSVEGQVAIYYDSMMDVSHPKLFINVVDANGRALNEIADEMVASLEGFDIERSSGLLIDGQWAETLDRMPGQDLSRQVMFLHNDKLYTLTFTPSDPSMGEVYQEMEALYELVRRSFRFLPEA